MAVSQLVLFDEAEIGGGSAKPTRGQAWPRSPQAPAQREEPRRARWSARLRAFAAGILGARRKRPGRPRSVATAAGRARRG
jgi:hypothetical protein